MEIIDSQFFEWYTIWETGEYIITSSGTFYVDLDSKIILIEVFIGATFIFD